MALLSTLLPTAWVQCALVPTLNREELEPTSSLVFDILNQAPTSQLPADVPITAIRSYPGFTPWGYLGDDVVSTQEQSIVNLVPGSQLYVDRDNIRGTSSKCSLLHNVDCLDTQTAAVTTLENEIEDSYVGSYTSIQVQSTLDGSAWSGAVHYSIAGTTTLGGSVTLTDTGCASPCSFSSTPERIYYNIPTGKYALNSVSGPSTQFAISPNATQTLMVNPLTGENSWNLTFTIAFTSTSLPTAAKPTFSPTPGTYPTTQTVSISATPGTIIHYAINGTPTVDSPIYSGPITVSSTETVEALATANGYTNSAVALATYVISSQTKPTVTSFGVSPTSAMLGSQLTATITGTAGANPLSIANLWRTTDLTGNTGWSQVASTTNVSGNSASVILHDTPSAVGTYLYGAHLGDTTGQYGVQPVAVQVVISAATPFLRSATSASLP
jgi:hypothetical protein